MKSLLLSLVLPIVLPAAELKDVKSVYLYPMTGGLDQHLANRLTKDHVFRVVADAKLADAVFTDQLGRQFEYRMDHIAAGKAKPALASSSPAPAASSTPAPSTPQSSTASPATSTAASEAEPHSSSFSSGKGTIFLVDAKSRQVVWSDYRLPRNNSSRELDKTAKQLATDLSKTLAPAPAGTK